MNTQRRTIADVAKRCLSRCLSTKGCLSTIVALISALALAISLGTFVMVVCPWPVEIYPPHLYTIIRGIPSKGFASDHLVLRFHFVNRGGNDRVVYSTKIVLKNKETGKELGYGLAGTYGEISESEFRKAYSMRNTFVVPAHSAQSVLMVFHLDESKQINWWDETGDYFDHNFGRNEKFSISIRYCENGKQRLKESFIPELIVPKDIDNILRPIKVEEDWVFVPEEYYPIDHDQNEHISAQKKESRQWWATYSIE